MEVDLSLPSGRVIRELKQIISWRGKPEVIRCDNGPEVHQYRDTGMGARVGNQA